MYRIVPKALEKSKEIGYNYSKGGVFLDKKGFFHGKRQDNGR